MTTLFPSRHDGTHFLSSTVYFRLDGTGCFNEFSPGWYSLCEKFRVEDFAPDHLLGRPVWSLVSKPWQDAIRERILCWLRGELPPPTTGSPNPEAFPFDDTLWRPWSPWPIRGALTRDTVNGLSSPLTASTGVQLTLDPVAQTHLIWGLSDPIWRGPHDGAGPMTPINATARRLLAERPELADAAPLQAWLNSRPQARRLTQLGGLDLDGDTLWRAQLPHLHGSSGFRLLGKLMRALLHDLSNPLAAVRMMAEVVSRGSRHYSDPSKVLPDMIRHLDLATATLRRLRALAQITPKTQALDTLAIFDEATQILRSELDRRETQVDLTALTPPEPELEGRTDALMLLALGTLLLTLSRSGEGDRLRLEATVDDETWRLRGYLESSGSPRPWFADPEIGIEALDRLVAPFNGRWLRLELVGDPMWELEIPL